MNRNIWMGAISAAATHVPGKGAIAVRRFLQPIISVTLSAFVLGLPTVSAQLGLPQSNLACSDSTNLNLALDAASLLGLSNAVAAIGFFPAGNPPLGCTLSQQSDPSGANGPKDFAVGGGRIFTPFGWANLAINAHATSDAPTVTPQQGVGGTVNETAITDSNSHIDTKVDCFVSPAPTHPTPGTAQATAVVTKSTGIFARFPVGSELRWDFFDSGVSGPAPNGDALNGNPASFPCDFSNYTADIALSNGNINVKNDDF